MNRNTKKQKRKELMKTRTLSEAEKKIFFDAFEAAILKEEFYDLKESAQAIEETPKDET